MKNTTVDFRLIEKEKNASFYGANTPDGFVITPDERIKEENCTRLMILKGGPGTGKSTLMRRFSDEAISAGYEVFCYYCSSDPDSLDAVTVQRSGESITVCDGTSPHVAEALYPGAVSEYVDLSASWNGAKLRKRKDEIFFLTDEKRKCFARAYAYLAASKDVAGVAKSIARSSANTEKIEAFAERFVSGRKPPAGSGTKAFASALTMKGAVTIPHDGARIYFVDDSFGVSRIVIGSIVSALERAGREYTAYLSPADPDAIESVIFGAAPTVVTSIPYNNETRRINCDRFLTGGAKKFRSRFRFVSKCRASLISSALESLAEASRFHFELEKIFTSCVNFKINDKLLRDRLLKIL